MPQRARAVLVSYGVIVAILCGSLALEQARGIGRAEAQPISFDAGVPLPALELADAPLGPGGSGSAVMNEAPPRSPLDDSKVIGESSWTMVQDYGPVWGVMLLLFGIGTAFAKRNPGHWLAAGNRMTLGVSAIGVLGALVEANFTAAPGAGLPVTMLMALKLLLHPRPMA